MTENEVLHEVLAAAGEVFEQWVSTGDNFLALGGDSLGAVELVLRLEERLSVDVDDTGRAVIRVEVEQPERARMPDDVRRAATAAGIALAEVDVRVPGSFDRTASGKPLRHVPAAVPEGAK